MDNKRMVRWVFLVVALIFVGGLLSFGCTDGGGGNGDQPPPLDTPKGPDVTVTKCTGPAGDQIDMQCNTDDASLGNRQCEDFDKNKNNNNLSGGQSGAYECVNKCYCKFTAGVVPPPPPKGPETPTAWQGIKQLGTKADDQVNGMVIDDVGNVYVVGATWGALEEGVASGTGADMFISKFNSTGKREWLKQIGSARSSADEVASAVVFNKGFLYVVGTTFGVLEGNRDSNRLDSDFVLFKFDENGSELWKKQFGSTGDENGRGIAVAKSGEHLYVTGLYFDPGANNSDMFLRAFDTSGNVLVTKTIISENDVNEAGNDVVVGADGIYVTGYSVGGVYSGKQPAYTGVRNILVAKYNSGVSLEKIEQLGNGENCNGNSIGMDDVNKKSHIVGYMGDVKSHQVKGSIIDYDSNLALLMPQYLNPSESEGSGNDIVVDKDSTVLVTGYTALNSEVDAFFSRLKSDGTTIWVKSIKSGSSAPLTPLSQGVSGGIPRPLNSGVQVLGEVKAGKDYGKVLSVDKEGNIFVAIDSYGSFSGLLNKDATNNTSDVYIIKFDKDGKQQ